MLAACLFDLSIALARLLYYNDFVRLGYGRCYQGRQFGRLF